MIGVDRDHRQSRRRRHAQWDILHRRRHCLLDPPRLLPWSLVAEVVPMSYCLEEPMVLVVQRVEEA